MIKRLAFLCLAGLLSESVVSAKPGDQLFEIFPDTAISDQDFGDAIAIHDQYVVIGAENRNSGAVLSAGTAFIFDAATGAQLHQLTPTDPAASRAFGTSVATDGERIVVGAEDDSSSRGAAYVFDMAGTQLFKLLASDGVANNQFGEVTSISGNFALVGAAPATGALGLGKVYLFDLTNATPGSTVTAMPLQPNDLPSSAEFGSTLDMDGDLAIIGMDRLGRGGGAYVYDIAGSLVRKFTPPINPANNQPVRGFGRSVAISGNIALVGATPDDGQVSSTEFGRAYLFDITTGQQLFELKPNDSQPEDLFGEGVSLSGNLAVVHARHEDVLGTVNTAYLFDVTTGEQLLQLTADVVAGQEAFEAVAINGGRVVAGVEGYGAAPPSIVNSGKALMFDVVFGDFNSDGIVNAADYTVWRDAQGQTVAAFTGADANGDTHIDMADYNLWKANFGVAAPASLLPGVGGIAAAGVPEPTACVMAILGFAPLMAFRRSRC